MNLLALLHRVHLKLNFIFFFVACLKLHNMGKIILRLGHFYIYKFEFAEYLRKAQNQIFENEKLFEIF